MATGNLTNNQNTFTFTSQINSITLNTANTFVHTNIDLGIKVTKAILNNITTDTDHKQFQIQIPNGNSTDIILTFAVDSSGNVLVT